MSKSNDWDDDERKKFPTEKYLFKKGQLGQVLADAYAFRFLFYCCNEECKFHFMELQKVCDKAHELFNFPQSPDDGFQIQEFIYAEMKKLGWKF